MNPTHPENPSKADHGPVPLGSWTLPSGNQCEATLVLDLPKAVSVRFAWASPPNGEDRDAVYVIPLPEALARAQAHIEVMVANSQALAELVSDGCVETRTDEDGNVLYRLTERGRVAAAARRQPDGGDGPRALELVPLDHLVEELRRRSDVFVLAIAQHVSETVTHEYVRSGGASLECIGLASRLVHKIDNDRNQPWRPEPRV